uniref:Alpha/beta hydrolase n=1 Tax=Ascaris lumbricoides TaxID=6252 RepID=A0A0M3IQC5_ASCLU
MPWHGALDGTIAEKRATFAANRGPGPLVPAQEYAVP